jgi:hypothetical protein
MFRINVQLHGHHLVGHYRNLEKGRFGLNPTINQFTISFMYTISKFVAFNPGCQLMTKRVLKNSSKPIAILQGPIAVVFPTA